MLQGQVIISDIYYTYNSDKLYKINALQFGSNTDLYQLME